MATFMLALFVGQTAATVAAYYRLPHSERSLAPFGSRGYERCVRLRGLASTAVVRPASHADDRAD